MSTYNIIRHLLIIALFLLTLGRSYVKAAASTPTPDRVTTIHEDGIAAAEDSIARLYADATMVIISTQQPPYVWSYYFRQIKSVTLLDAFMTHLENRTGKCLTSMNQAISGRECEDDVIRLYALRINLSSRQYPLVMSEYLAFDCYQALSGEYRGWTSDEVNRNHNYLCKVRVNDTQAARALECKIKQGLKHRVDSLLRQVSVANAKAVYDKYEIISRQRDRSTTLLEDVVSSALLSADEKREYLRRTVEALGDFAAENSKNSLYGINIDSVAEFRGKTRTILDRAGISANRHTAQCLDSEIKRLFANYEPIELHVPINEEVIDSIDEEDYSAVHHNRYMIVVNEYVTQLVDLQLNNRPFLFLAWIDKLAFLGSSKVWDGVLFHYTRQTGRCLTEDAFAFYSSSVPYSVRSIVQARSLCQDFPTSHAFCEFLSFDLQELFRGNHWGKTASQFNRRMELLTFMQQNDSAQVAATTAELRKMGRKQLRSLLDRVSEVNVKQIYAIYAHQSEDLHSSESLFHALLNCPLLSLQERKKSVKKLLSDFVRYAQSIDIDDERAVTKASIQQFKTTTAQSLDSVADMNLLADDLDQAVASLFGSR